MLHLGMPLALFGADTASLSAGFDLSANKAGVSFCLPQEYPARRFTDVRAIQVKADATDQHAQMLLLGETGVGARRAGLCTVEALFNAAKQIWLDGPHGMSS